MRFGKAMDPAAPYPAGGPGLVASWVNFWFTPADPVGLHAVRFLAGLLFLTWLLPFAGDYQALFGLGGWFDGVAYAETYNMGQLPPNLFGWSILFACGTDPVKLAAAYWVSVASIGLFTLGILPRVTGVLTWVAVVSFTASPAVGYDADPMLLMLAFYLMVGYLGLGLAVPGRALGERLLGPRTVWPLRWRSPADEAGPSGSVAANLALRLFQVHFALAMVASGLHKLQTQEWWSGFAAWFYLHPPFETTLSHVRAIAPNADSYLNVTSLATYVALVWQLAFPTFAWRRRCRPLLLGGAVLAFLADVFVINLPLFGPVMVIGSLSYLTPAEWRWLVNALARLPGVRTLGGRATAAPEAVGAGSHAAGKVSHGSRGHRG
jgi:hypothetical protein